VRYLILSDVHANWEALDAVIRESGGRYDRALCCGDLIGYGADPNRVVDWVRENCAVTVRGNHDKASSGLDDLEWFNPVARRAAMWTQETLTPENMQWIRALPTGPVDCEDFQVLHGSPYDEDEYVVAATEASQAFEYLQRRIAFFGHTHLQGGFIWNHSRVETIPRTSLRTDRQTLEIDPECAYLLNAGSVGQPRDGDPRAAFAIYDAGAHMVTFFRAEYDVAGAQKRIRDAGLPDVLADRLTVGR
jgi:diadenosine tetraphosphatase ApaH/serine/threonine PP2A family protein phosphatase